MPSLDNDTKNLISKQNEPRPTQFQVSSKLIASKNFRGNKGLIMLAIESGAYEPCVQVMLMLETTRNPPGTDMIQYEEGVRGCLANHDYVERAYIIHKITRSNILKNASDRIW